jgi:hypothetical protein
MVSPWYVFLKTFSGKFNVHGTVHRYCILLSITNKMQRCTIFFITVNALHVSGGFSAHHHELKTVYTASGTCQACLLLNCIHSIWYVPGLLAATSSGSSKQAWHIPDAVWTVLSSWWWAEKSPETCTALTSIKNIVQRCILLVIIKRMSLLRLYLITDHVSDKTSTTPFITEWLRPWQQSLKIHHC